MSNQKKVKEVSDQKIRVEISSKEGPSFSHTEGLLIGIRFFKEFLSVRRS